MLLNQHGTLAPRDSNFPPYDARGPPYKLPASADLDPEEKRLGGLVSTHPKSLLNRPSRNFPPLDLSIFTQGFYLGNGERRYR